MLGVGTNVFSPLELPTPIGLAVMVQIIVPDHQLGTQETLSVGVLGPNMQPLVDPMEGPVGLEDYPNRPPGWEGSMFAPIGVQFLAESPGTHTIEFGLEGRSTLVSVLVRDPEEAGRSA